MRKERWFDELDVLFDDLDKKEETRDIDSSPLDEDFSEDFWEKLRVEGEKVAPVHRARNLLVGGEASVNLILATRKAVAVMEAGESFRVITPTKTMAAMIRFGMETLTGRKVDNVIDMESWLGEVYMPGKVYYFERDPYPYVKRYRPNVWILDNNGEIRFFFTHDHESDARSLLKDMGIPVTVSRVTATCYERRYFPLTTEVKELLPVGKVPRLDLDNSDAFEHVSSVRFSKHRGERAKVSNTILVGAEELVEPGPYKTKFSTSGFREYILPWTRNISLFIDRFSLKCDLPDFMNQEFSREVIKNTRKFYFMRPCKWLSGRVTRFNSNAAEMGFISGMIKNWGLEDVAVIAPTDKLAQQVCWSFRGANIKVQGHFNEVDTGYALSDRPIGLTHEQLASRLPLEVLDIHFDDPSLPFITTYDRAKGLSFETIFLPFVDDPPPEWVMNCATKQLFMTNNAGRVW